jgi:cation transport ATPase
MLHIGALLLVGGIAGAIYRDRAQKKHVSLEKIPESSVEYSEDKALVSVDSVKTVDASFDDVAELKHYQRVSFYTFALTSAGSLFYWPVTFLGLPLLGYNAYHFTKMLRHSDRSKQRSAMTVFEIIGVAGSLMASKPVAASVVMLFSFFSRNILLQAGNIANNIDSVQGLDLKRSSLWVLRDGVEVEVILSQLQEKDIVVFHSGDAVSLEGKVVDGSCEVNQFSLKREMKCVQKKVGDKVFPFTRISQGTIYVLPG